MMKSEFVERVGFEPTNAEYEEIEAEYMGTDIDKDEFCKQWKRNGGVLRLMRLRARRIEELENELKQAEKKYEDMEKTYSRNASEYMAVSKERYGELCKKYEQVQAINAEMDEKMHEAIDEAEKLRAKLNIVREAMCILGISNREEQ